MTRSACSPGCHAHQTNSFTLAGDAHLPEKRPIALRECGRVHRLFKRQGVALASPTAAVMQGQHAVINRHEGRPLAAPLAPDDDAGHAPYRRTWPQTRHFAPFGLTDTCPVYVAACVHRMISCGSGTPRILSRRSFHSWIIASWVWIVGLQAPSQIKLYMRPPV